MVAPYLLEPYYLETQQASWLPKALVALCMGILQTKTTSQVDYRILQELFYAFTMKVLRRGERCRTGFFFAVGGFSKGFLNSAAAPPVHDELVVPIGKGMSGTRIIVRQPANLCS